MMKHGELRASRRHQSCVQRETLQQDNEQGHQEVAWARGPTTADLRQHPRRQSYPSTTIPVRKSSGIRDSSSRPIRRRQTRYL